jgi:hypothetical protein
MPGGKSLFFNVNNTRTTTSGQRPLIAGIIGGGGNEGLCLLGLPDTLHAAINTLRDQYTVNMATKNYSGIPFDIAEYAYLKTTLMDYEIRMETLNPNLAKLLGLCENALDGAVNSLYLKNANTDYTIKQAVLEKRIADILSERNVIKTNALGSGEISLRRQFKLSPIFSLYVYIFGLPEAGVGFDMLRLERIRVVMQEYGLVV